MSATKATQKKLVTEKTRETGQIKVDSFLVASEEIPVGEFQLKEWFQQWKEDNAKKFQGEPIFVYHWVTKRRLYVCSVLYQPV